MVLTAHFPPDLGAASVRMFELVNRLSSYENVQHVKVIAYNPQSREAGLPSFSKNEIIDVFRPKNIIPRQFHLLQIINPLTLLEWITLCFKQTNKYKPNIIISTVPVPHPAIVCWIYNNIFKIPYCVDIRDNWSGTIDDLADELSYPTRFIIRKVNSLVNKIFLQSLKNAALISTVNKTLEVEFSSNLATKTIIMQNGINVLELNEIKSNFDKEKILRENKITIDPTSQIIVYVGDLGAPYHKPEILLKAIKNLNYVGNRINYIIIGDGRSSRTISNMAEAYGIRENIYLVGKKSHKQVIELLLCSDFAFYSLQSGAVQAKHAIGVKILEYIACNLPILAIADDDSAVSKLIKDNNIGISANWSKTDEIDKLLLKLMNYYGDYKTYIQEYYDLNKVNFDRNISIDILYHSIEDLLIT